MSPDVHMPSDFGPESAQLAWRVPVRGSGASSPVISDGRIYLTSAYQGEARSKIKGWTTGVTFSCAAPAAVFTQRFSSGTAARHLGIPIHPIRLRRC